MKKVIILGGGVAGMSAAHELIERGYAVEVYEFNKQYVGGKARSVDYFGSPNHPYPNALPGEHGFRFFPGFYKHVIDTMKRIPYKQGKSGASVFDNLTATSRVMLARYNKTPLVTVASFPKNLSDIELLIHDMHGADSGLTTYEEKFFAQKIWQLITSSTQRRNNDYERLGWWQYLEADKFPKNGAYQNLLVQGLTRTLVAARAEKASTKTGGDIFLQLIFGMCDPTVNTDRVLDGPTNERWLYAWKDYLLSKGVIYIHDAEVKKLHVDKKTTAITSATIDIQGFETEIKGDYFVMAVPVEKAAILMDDDLIAEDATLAYIKTLAPSTSWMNGIQFYLNQDVQINKGHVIYSDSEWALTSISQIQFWQNYNITTKGNGKVKGILSVDISDWQAEGRFTTKKMAQDCTRKEVAEEVWAQLKNSLNVNGQTILSDDMMLDWFLDRDIQEDGTHANHENMLQMPLKNREPLLVNSVNSWNLRPDANCDIPNLFLASDYVKTFTDLATMEGANEAARRAVNCLLDHDGNSASKCKIWPLHEPAMFKPLRWYDKLRWNDGLPWRMHTPWWLKLFMIPWVILCLVAGLFQLLVKKIMKS
ncbi:MAG: FAD-dependent oxidoreductase [Bacteroidetes bacterium]|nr:FAD-dependent oxidoreductase [Bacteroidota bacterium]